MESVTAGPARPSSADPPSARLRRKIQLASGPLAAASTRLVHHERIAELLPEYLVATHHIIRTTVPLMEAAIDRARALGGADPVAAGVGAYLEIHVEEERHHDEWLLDDIEVLGLDRTAVLERVPSPTVASLAGAQYYWILHHHPVALLGYLAFMEGEPPTPELINGLMDRTGFPPEAFRTLVAHGELDPGHRDELDRTIDSLPLTRQQEAVVGLSAMTSADHLARVVEEVLEEGGT